MLSLSLWWLALLGLLVGVLIGGIGIGGVLLVPALTYLGGIDIHLAIASCMFSYLFSGAVGVLIYARRGSIRWSMCGWLTLGAMPGAYAGAFSLSLVPGTWLELLIALLILFAGFNALARDRQPHAEEAALGRVALVAIGALTGFASAMSGTGGPLVLVPLLVWLKLPVLMVVGLSQVIQLPVSILATAGNLAHGRVDLWLGLAIALVLMLGVNFGARIAHRLPAALLKRIVALALIAVAGLILTRLATSLVPAAS